MLALDHIVIAAVDPKLAAEQFAKQHKVKVVKGGKHDLWGTYNYLAYFSNDSYMEWLGIFDEEIANRSTNPLIRQLVDRLSNHEEGFFQFALRTDGIDEYIEHFTENRLAFTGPISGSRQKPDGSILEWSMLFPDQLPFLIEWGETRNLPDDLQAINQQQLNLIHANNIGQNNFKQTFNVESTDQNIQLSNGILNFSGDKMFDFKIH